MSLDYGRPFPMGSHYDGYGVNFTLFSENATKVILCLFDKAGKEIRYFSKTYSKSKIPL